MPEGHIYMYPSKIWNEIIHVLTEAENLGEQGGGLSPTLFDKGGLSPPKFGCQ